MSQEEEQPVCKKARTENPFQLRVMKLSDHATLPVRGSEKAAGYDLASAYDDVVPAQDKALIKTDLAIAVPSGYYGRIAPRSSLAWKNHIDVGAGVIDEDYRGNVGIVLFNHGANDLFIKKGDRVAQLIIEQIGHPEVLEVSSLMETSRCSGGFGSTGQ